MALEDRCNRTTIQIWAMVRALCDIPLIGASRPSGPGQLCRRKGSPRLESQYAFPAFTPQKDDNQSILLLDSDPSRLRRGVDGSLHWMLLAQVRDQLKLSHAVPRIARRQPAKNR